MGFQVTFWGVRGTLPCPYATHLAFGGNTSCVEVAVGDSIVILDAGTGLRRLGKRLMQEKTQSATLLLTHTHWDHISGFPFFEPAYMPGFSMRIMAGHLSGGPDCVRSAVSKCMESPLFPVPLKTMRSNLSFEDFQPGAALPMGPDVTIRTMPLNHPGGAVGYRVEHGGKAFCFVTDTEHVPDRPDDNVLALIDGADLVVYDTCYTEAQFAARRGWGHSTWTEAVKLCRMAGVERLALFHHDPDHDDVAMTAIEMEAQREMPGAFAAREGSTLALLPA